MTPEGAVLCQVLDYFAAKDILAFRMNTGAIKVDKRFFKFGVAGMADVLAFPWMGVTDGIVPLWVECKAPKGKQSELQKSFQELVEEHGHRYVVAHSIDDLKALG